VWVWVWRHASISSAEPEAVGGVCPARLVRHDLPPARRPRARTRRAGRAPRPRPPRLPRRDRRLALALEPDQVQRLARTRCARLIKKTRREVLQTRRPRCACGRRRCCLAPCSAAAAPVRASRPAESLKPGVVGVVGVRARSGRCVVVDFRRRGAPGVRASEATKVRAASEATKVACTTPPPRAARCSSLDPSSDRS